MSATLLDGRLTMHVGDVRDVLLTMPDASVNCVVTSPPYFGLRDYETPGQIGLEPTPTAFVETIVGVFREVRRVLREEGTCWLNIGDSYAGSWGAQSRRITESDAPSWHGSQIRNHKKRASHMSTIREEGLKPKDLMMIPARVAMALRDDGWFLRKDIIWHKPNPMPESVTDRPTSAHEHLFLLTKSGRYWYDADAIREKGEIPAGTKAAKGSAERFAASGVNSRPPEYKTYDGFRNARDVWTIATQPFSGDHSATFPPELARRCIFAGCPKGGVVLDPFGGAGTTGLAALRHGRTAQLIEINPQYAAMAQRRIEREWRVPQPQPDDYAGTLFA